MINKVLAIQNCGPSGTTLIQSLLDGHPQILSLPALHAQELLIFWERVADFSRRDIQEKFMKDFHHFFSSDALNNGLGLKELGPDQNETAIIDEVNFTQFLNNYWRDLSLLTRKQFLDGVYIAYNQSLGRDVSQAEYILYPIHCLPIQYAKALVEDYAQVRFLHSVREPVQSIGSLAKHIDKNPGWDPLYILTCVSAQLIGDYAIHVGHREAYGMKPYFPDSEDGRILSRAVRLEDIHRSPKETLNKICLWLNVKWSDKLLSSTFNDKLWHNRPESIRQSGVGAKTISQRHSDIISKFDRYRFNLLTLHYQNKFSYDGVKVGQSLSASFFTALLLLAPFKLEYQIERMKRQYRLAESKIMARFKSKVLSRVFSLPYYFVSQFKNYITCRKNWLFPAWLRIRHDKKFDYVELL